MADKRKRHTGGSRAPAIPARPTRRPHHPVPDVTADVDRYDEAIHAFQKRLPVSRPEWEEMTAGERRRSFSVAGVAQADMVTDVWESIDRAIRDGKDFEEFQAEVLPTVTEAWGGEIPGRIECLPGDNFVTGAVIRAVHRRRYEGKIAEIVTYRGRKFTATPNHPMLTRRGWVSAGKLREGDDLISHRRKEDPGSNGNYHEAEPPARITEIFDSLAHSRISERVRGQRLDFHGDGSDGDVDVVRTNRPLLLGDFAAIRKPLEQYAFPESDLSCPRFCTRCGHLIVITKRCGFCDRSVRDAGCPEAIADRAVARIKMVGERIRALAREITTRQFFDWNVLAFAGRGAAAREEQIARIAQPARHPGVANRIRHPLERCWHRGSHFSDAQSSEIEFDRVRSVRFGSFSGHVFNLSTTHGYFAMDGLYTGNTIFRTNVMDAYNGGREAVFTAPAVKEARPYSRFDAIDDDRTCPECEALNSVTLPIDDPFWDSNSPPLHFCDRCVKTGVSQAEVDDAGGPDEVPEGQFADEGFGARPSVNGSDWKPDLAKYPEPIADALRVKLDT
jgi:hypothetical protein